MVLSDFDSAPALQDLPVPEPGPEQVRVRVKAAGLNKIDALISAGMLKGTAAYEFPVVLGRDAAGIVDAVGSDVRNVATGDEVIGHELLAGSPLHDGDPRAVRDLAGHGSPASRQRSTSPPRPPCRLRELQRWRASMRLTPARGRQSSSPARAAALAPTRPARDLTRR